VGARRAAVSEPPTPEDVANYLRHVYEPGMVIELRMLGVIDNSKYPPFTMSGYYDYDHFGELAKVAMEWTPSAEGVYVTVNAASPDLLARAANRVVKRPKCTTSDGEIIRRVGLVFDADPRRPAGVSATDEEVRLAWARIRQVAGELTARGWPDPILALSGNGGHARYRIDLPANDDGLVERVLKVASAKLSDAQVEIDAKLFNAARIIKLYGTVARKGDNVEGRPHRYSRVIKTPADFQVVSVELLEAFAAEYQPAPSRTSTTRQSRDDPGRPAPRSGASPADRARAYLFAPGFPDSIAGEDGHGVLYRVACELVDGFGLTYGEAMPILASWNAAKAQPPESQKQLEHKLSDAVKNHPVPSCRRLSVGRDPRESDSNGSLGGDLETSDPGKLVLVTSLASSIRPVPVDFLDGGVIPRGKLVTLAGLGGSGKGMFWANMVADLTNGRGTFGMDYEPLPSIEVLLVGCEDGYADTVVPRLLAADGDLDRVHILEGVRDQNGRLLPFSLVHLDPLAAFLKGHPKVQLVIIDPIAGYVGRAGVMDHHDTEVRSLLEPLAELANRSQTTILTVKHLNKDEARTVASRVGGSVAYVNVPRACFVVAADPEDDTCRVLAPFKWNLNAPMPPSVAWTMDPPPREHLAGILAKCDHLDEEDREKLAGQLHRLSWLGEVDVTADDLLRTAAKKEKKSTPDEMERATQWLQQRLKDGPVGSILAAKEGDRFLGRRWPDPKLPPEERRRIVFGRTKWWRENVLKGQLDGETKQVGYQGPWLFRLPEHAWPPSDAAIEAARRADEELASTEATEATEATGSRGGGAAPGGASVEEDADFDLSGLTGVPTESSQLTPDSVDSVDTVAPVETEEGDL
jgi:hypothetical protein